MANSIDVGCKSGSGNAVQRLFEAIKSNGAIIGLSSGYYTNVNLSNYSYVAFGLRANDNYAVSFGYRGMTSNTPGVACSIPAKDQYGNNGHIYFGMVNFSDAQLRSSPYTGSSYEPYNIIQCYYIGANTYDELITQLGGGIKPYYILSPIIILEVREYGKYCGYWLRKRRRKTRNW